MVHVLLPISYQNAEEQSLHYIITTKTGPIFIVKDVPQLVISVTSKRKPVKFFVILAKKDFIRPIKHFQPRIKTNV